MTTHWQPGPPPGRGRWWVVWTTLQGERRVEPIEISPAVIRYDDPNARLLFKTMTGVAMIPDEIESLAANRVEPNVEARSVPCPNCGATTGYCKRPSGHKAMTAHAERWDAALRALGGQL